MYVTGDNPTVMHQEFAAALDGALDTIRAIQDHARPAPPAGHGAASTAGAAAAPRRTGR